MSLNKRLALLLLPIIIIGYGCATFLIYYYQKSHIVELEQAKLDQRMFQLQAVFKEEAATADHLMALFLEGHYLSDFLLHAPSTYRDTALSQSVSSLISQTRLNKSSRIAFSLFSGNGSPLFYYERSADPFATISDEQYAVSRQMLDSHTISDWVFFHQALPSQVVSARLLDRVGLLPFKGRDIDDSIQLSFSVQLDAFSSHLSDLATAYKTAPVWTERHTRPEAILTHTVALSSTQYLTITPDQAALNASMFGFLIKLMFIAAVLAVFTYWLLIFLISRFITAPISQLDKELTQVMHYQKENISPSLSNSEMGRLSNKFYELFEQLQNNLKKTHEMAITDTLTSLPNRFRFYEYAKHVLLTAEQSKEYVSLVYIDIDNFKFVNDKLGHEAGDNLLCFLAEDLHRLLLPIQQQYGGCMVSRLSGDEFAIVLTHHLPEEVDQLAQSIVELFEGGYESDDYYFPVSASMGIASYPVDGHSLKALIANADMAMYHAKRSGKNRYKHYSASIAAEARRKKSIEDQLKTLDCEKEFSLVYMPYTCANDQVKGFEVLIRWHSSELGHVHPEEFIPIAEQTGTYAKIDHWVFETAFKSLPQVRAIFGEACLLSINISAAELGHHVVLERLIELKALYGIDDSSIELELTETFGYVQTDSVFDVLNGLQEAGFNIAIDDFGVGYTPLLHMIDYPVNKVKLDKVLTARVTDSDYAKLLPPLIQLCHLQAIAVTAEGIENEHQLASLKAAGCDFFQGYWLSKPMPFDELARWHEGYQSRQINLDKPI
ncbi:EAL domain-containing protein [Marinomonas sp. M1K-6]|uniref:EAL domain-containing protein n=1 Tax=Marinomonas profundi TaxID=2726122 RepID=A0A847R3R7_9GAMM|nr:EAL domain-containing protein [Marinomonas profundi]NLQ18595.1 EAL domain-containing protein [Marinomonas profundi]UDV02911.1 EAL domain-containing protein [Marinomonas profundi]